MSNSLLPFIIQPFVCENPNANIQIKQGPNMDLWKDILDGHADFLFGRILPASALLKRIQYMTLCKEELVILLNKNHPLAECDELDLRQLKDEDFIFFHQSTGFHLIVENLFQQAGYKPKIRYQVYDNSSCEVMVSANLGVALVGVTPDNNKAWVRQIKIKFPKEYQTNIYIIWDAGNKRISSGLCANFLQHVQRLYAWDVNRKT